MLDNNAASAARRRMPLEWPTLVVALLIYTVFIVLTWHYHSLPWWILLSVGAYVVAWHGSLQHETVHGHPTPWRWVNELLVFPSLWLWMPYGHYRASHLRHHRNEHLTDPAEDPESFYVSQDHWDATGPLSRRLLAFHNTLSGRLLMGPAVAVWKLCVASLVDLRRGRTFCRRTVGVHLLSCALVLTWVVYICDIPLLAYIALFAYPGTSLTLLRSFAEHRARRSPDERTVVVEAEPALALLYLNNNLHSAHHRYPQAPWYELPRRWREDRSEILKSNGHYLLGGYRVLFRHYLFCRKEPVRYPFSMEARPASMG
jgi:fatty acid desaturase